MAEKEATEGRRMETAMFVFLAFILFPLLSTVLIAGFGFIVWMKQLLMGPPPLV